MSVPTALDSPVPGVVSTVGVGTPQHIPLVTNLKRIADTNRVQAILATVSADARAFFAVSAGTSAADARIIQDNVMPVYRVAPVVREETTIELPAVAYELAEGDACSSP